MLQLSFFSLLYRTTNLFLVLILAVVCFYTALSTIKHGTQLYLERTKDWTATSIQVIGEDVWVSGATKNPVECTYFPPPLARGLGYKVEDNLSVTSWNPAKSQQWPASNNPQKFGPWQVHGGSHYLSIEFYQHFDCFDILPIGAFTVHLGTIVVPSAFGK